MAVYRKVVSAWFSGVCLVKMTIWRLKPKEVVIKRWRNTLETAKTQNSGNEPIWGLLSVIVEPEEILFFLSWSHTYPTLMSGICTGVELYWKWGLGSMLPKANKEEGWQWKFAYLDNRSRASGFREGEDSSKVLIISMIRQWARAMKKKAILGNGTVNLTPSSWNLRADQSHLDLF